MLNVFKFVFDPNHGLEGDVGSHFSHIYIVVGYTQGLILKY